jgi:Zn-dependent M32 family carboxypeptidase
MPKLPQSDTNIQKSKQGQRKNSQEKSPVNPTWGKTLTKQELLALLDRLDQKRKDREMNKMAETLARALEKKQGKTHVDGSDVAATDTKVKKVKTAPPTGKKPPTRSAGRGR